MNVYLEKSDIETLIKLVEYEAHKMRSALTDDNSDYSHISRAEAVVRLERSVDIKTKLLVGKYCKVEYTPPTEERIER